DVADVRAEAGVDGQDVFVGRAGVEARDACDRAIRGAQQDAVRGAGIGALADVAEDVGIAIRLEANRAVGEWIGKGRYAGRAARARVGRREPLRDHAGAWIDDADVVVAAVGDVDLAVRSQRHGLRRADVRVDGLPAVAVWRRVHGATAREGVDVAG